ncbi:hypothetical protein BDR03DRAFT_900768 [Suillus americanus]|nr:hypothetical protein BDR03DRAFT_900768 [Suillus americanus]
MMTMFLYDGEGEPDCFSIAKLQSIVNRYFLTSCKLEKLAEGGYHKVYDIFRSDGTPLDAVVRVASPAFPKDKLESEVPTSTTTIAAFTNVPVPRMIYTWNSDALNPVGGEYMILDKTKGIPARQNCGDLSEEVKRTVVSQVARYLMEIFSLRSESAGSIYLSPLSHPFVVGSIISTPFYRAVDGVARVPAAPILQNIDPNRGPFTTVTEYLSTNLRAELEFISNRSLVLSELYECDPTQSAESRLELGERVMRKAIELCSVYPGDMSVLTNITTPRRPVSLKLQDFSLSNVSVLCLCILLMVSIVNARVYDRSMQIQVE